MRPPIFAACALGLLSTQCLAAISAPVTSVVLYPGSATVVRTAQVSAGATEAVLAGLPANFNLETLRAQATPGIRIGEVVTQEAAGVKAVNPAEAALVARIQTLKDQQALLAAEIKSATIVKNYIERFDAGAGAAEKETAGIDAKTLAGVIGTLGRGASDALLKIEKLTVQQRELGVQVDMLQRDLARLQSGARDTRAVTVRLAATSGARPEGVWPAGTIQLFRDGSYVGATHWDLQDAERAQFGRDEQVKVTVAALDGMSGNKASSTVAPWSASQATKRSRCGSPLPA